MLYFLNVYESYIYLKYKLPKFMIDSTTVITFLHKSTYYILSTFGLLGVVSSLHKLGSNNDTMFVSFANKLLLTMSLSLTTFYMQPNNNGFGGFND